MQEYERVKKQYNQRSKEKAKAASELEGTNEQMQKITAKLEVTRFSIILVRVTILWNVSFHTEATFLLLHMKEYKQKCRDLEYEKRTAQKQIESLESQKKSLSEKYELVQVNVNVFVQFRSHICHW